MTNMAFNNVTQMIEKKHQQNIEFLKNTWRNEECSWDANKDSLVFENCLTGIATDVSAIDLDKKSPENTDKESGQKNSISDVEEDHDRITEKTSLTVNKLCYDEDDTDYFDSEDEYWESLRGQQIDTEYCPRCLRHHHQRESIGNKQTFSCYLEFKAPVFTAAVEKFAKDNDFEVHDVYGDGNCLFRAVADQFMVNGCQGHTELSLRQIAIKHLEENPAKYGEHASSFLSDETWEEYLHRMKHSGEWGDHIMLQALADVFLLHINVYDVVYNDIRRTDIIANLHKELIVKFPIFLGHIGESHYFSLRPLQWMAELPYKAHIYRMLATCTDKTLEERTSLMDERLAKMSHGHFPESSMADPVQFVLQCISFDESSKNDDKTCLEANFKHIFKSFSRGILRLDQSSDFQKSLIENQMHVDALSGIPVYHLTFIMKHAFPMKMFCKHSTITAPLYIQGETTYHFLGTFANDTFVTLRDISPAQKMKLVILDQKRSKLRKIVVLKSHLIAIHTPINDSITVIREEECLYMDCSDTKPGYCRLRLPQTSSVHGDEKQIFLLDSNKYLKHFTVPTGVHLQMKLMRLEKIEHMGVFCISFPFSLRWADSRRRCDFPSHVLIDSIIERGCTLIPKSHPNSAFPNIEWQFNFSMAELLIFNSLTLAQKHGFYVLKVLLDNMIHHLPFKPKHLKNVFLNACEEIPSSGWETNFGGCVLHVLDALLACLKARFLPNYFIPERNLIECYREDDINTMITIVEFIRLFPAYTIQIVAEKHGFTYCPNLIKCVLSNIEAFMSTKSCHVTFHELFLPLTISTSKSMAKMGFYLTSYDMLEEAFERSLLIPEEGQQHKDDSFSNFFVKALMKMKQRSSRMILAELYNKKTGLNLLDDSKKPVLSLQTCLEWPVESRLNWLEVPSEAMGNLTAISRLLYECSQKEHLRRNKLLAELTIKTGIQCIKEALKQEPFHLDKLGNAGLKAEIDAETSVIKRKLIQCYIHLFFVSRMDFCVAPLDEYINEIESLCKEFPEMTGIVSDMFGYLSKPDKSQQYHEMFNEYFYGNSSYYHQIKTIQNDIKY